MNIGQRIREIREDLGMQRTVLARRVGAAENTIYRIETGKRTPSMELLEKIARELRTEPAELLRGEPVAAGKAEASETGQNNEAGPRGFTRMLSREEVVNRMILAEKSEDAARDIINSIADSEVPVTRDTYKRIARQRLAEIADHEPQTLMDKRAERRLLALIEALNNPDAMTPYRIKQLVSEDVG